MRGLALGWEVNIWPIQRTNSRRRVFKNSLQWHFIVNSLDAAAYSIYIFNVGSHSKSNWKQGKGQKEETAKDLLFTLLNECNPANLKLTVQLEFPWILLSMKRPTLAKTNCTSIHLWWNLDVCKITKFCFWPNVTNISEGAPSCVATEQNIANSWGRGLGKLVTHRKQPWPKFALELDWYILCESNMVFVTFKFRGQKKMHEWANKCNPKHWKFYVNSSKSCKKQAKVQNVSKDCHP